jgi:phosphatidylglycerol:prolipoprotein diacylglycerol transferase
VIPYFQLREIPVAGGICVTSFGCLVLLGVIAGVAFAQVRARVFGIPPEEIAAASAWTVGLGFPVSHLTEALLYRPSLLEGGGALGLFGVWNGLSSFGGLLGALLGLLIHFRRSKEPWLVHAEILVQALVVGWLFGRLGCTLVHDHLGRTTSFPLAIALPTGPRHDLGFYELLYTALVLLPALAFVNRRPRPPGTTVCVIALLYAPARFLADFLRATDLPGSDPRYGGLTPAQYACFGLLAVGLYFARRTIGSPPRRARARRPRRLLESYPVG